jgi:putative ABC transport system permease protein
MRQFVKNVLPESLNNAEVVYRNQTERTTVNGTTTEYEVVVNTPAAKGRFFNKTEERAGARVAVLGHKIANDLFEEIDPINKQIRINDVSFTVVGVAEEKGGGFGGPSFDDYVFIPLEAYFRLFNTKDINSISVQVQSADQIPSAIRELETYMEDVQNRDEDEYDVFDQREILETINQILGVLTIGLGGIAAISLVVGGIGIMNIMLVSVTERTREIGLRKAIGATPNQILLQFLIESAMLSFIGGMIGVALAALLSLLIRVVADFPSAITPGAILLAFGVSVAVGVIFGVAPARKASKLSPIEALRSE